jgi:hypothetical protein
MADRLRLRDKLRIRVPDKHRKLRPELCQTSQSAAITDRHIGSVCMLLKAKPQDSAFVCGRHLDTVVSVC